MFFLTSLIRRYHAQFTPELGTSVTNLVTFDGAGLPMSVPLVKPPPTGVYRLESVVP